MSPVTSGGPDVLVALRARLVPEGLNIVLPVDPVGFDDACKAVGAPPLGSLLDGAAGAIVVGDGGPEFFSRFQAAYTAAGGGSDPLDGYTRERVSGVVIGVSAKRAWTYRILYPFERPLLPFQRLGHAAGLPAPGPLGIQIHPVYGPWWAYRALIVVTAPLEVADTAITRSCDECPQPCVVACPGRAVLGTGFSPERCITHRHLDPACRESCGARIACPVGTAHRYPRDQLAFHMKASLAQIRNRGLASS